MKNSIADTIQLIKVLIIICVSIGYTSLQAQNDNASSNKWNFTVAPYLIFPHMNGDVAIKGIPIEVDVAPSDIFDNLNFGMMLYLEASKNKWIILADGLYMDLGQKGETPFLSREASVNINQLAVSLSGRYKVTSWADLGLGLRINSIGSKVKIAPGEYILPGTNFSMTETWVDPIIVGRAMTRFDHSKWLLGLSADIGGFGIGSKFTWQINPFAGYRISKLLELGIGYRWLGMEYENGNGTDLFLYNVTTSGPEMRLSFYF